MEGIPNNHMGPGKKKNLVNNGIDMDKLLINWCRISFINRTVDGRNPAPPINGMIDLMIDLCDGQ